VGDEVITATGGNGVIAAVGGGDETNCVLGGGEDAVGADVVTIPDCGTLGITVKLSRLGALVALLVGATVDGFPVAVCVGAYVGAPSSSHGARESSGEMRFVEPCEGP
jgi:hypothetical protein